MTDPRETPPSVRILVVLDESPYGHDATEVATSLAADLRAELRALFVEDVNLLRLAALPFTREVDQTSAAIRPLDTATMERALRAKAAEVRQTVTLKAKELRVQWSFQVARGEFVRSSLAAAAESDLLILAREAQRPKPAPRRQRPARGASVVVAYDGSASAERVLQAAVKLARRLDAKLDILNIAPVADQRDAIDRSLSSWLSEQKLEGSIHDVAAEDAKALVQQARQCEGRALVVNRDCHLLNETTIASLVDELEHPIVLVG